MNAPEWLVAAPKVVLHDHLDGGVRPATLAEFARRAGRDVLDVDPGELAALLERTSAGDLVSYLEPFAYTSQLLGSAAAMYRVAVEAVEDLAADGVVYAELRFAPVLHRRAGFDLSAVIDAVSCGVRDAAFDAAAAGRFVHPRLIVVALRDQPGSAEVAEAAAAAVGGGVVGFDLAGPELGHCASRHRSAFEVAAAAGLGVTVHAGEAAGLGSVTDALSVGADRIGHGCALADDLDVRDGTVALGDAAAAATGVHVEVCPSSNVHTGAVASLDAHPLPLLVAAGFSVGISCDNRTMSATSTSAELAACAETFGWGPGELAALQHNALRAAFDRDAAFDLAERVTAGWETTSAAV